MAAKEIKTMNIVKEVLIAAPADIVFETVLEPQGGLKDLNMKLEPWPGGRWFRDLGNNAGHLWGHVQVIKPPKLLEICGPMMMSYPVACFVQYRLTEESAGTRLTLIHQAFGMIKPEHLTGFEKGWTEVLDRTKARAEQGGPKR